jgi:hypothetical protein
MPGLYWPLAAGLVRAPTPQPKPPTATAAASAPIAATKDGTVAEIKSRFDLGPAKDDG